MTNNTEELLDDLNEAGREENWSQVLSILQEHPQLVYTPCQKYYRDGEMPLHHAVSNRVGNYAAILLALGVNPNIQTIPPHSLPNNYSGCEKATAGDTPLHLAVRPDEYEEEMSPDLAVINNLLDHPDIDVNIQNSSGWTPLHAALSQSVEDDEQNETLVLQVVGLMVTKHPGIAMEIRGGSDEQTPLAVALNSSRPRAAGRLIQYGAKVLEIDKDRNTALHLAAEMGLEDDEMADCLALVDGLLLRDDIDVNHTNNNGQTALHRACDRFQGHPVLQRLINQGAIIDARDNDGNTPLHKLCGSCYYHDEDEDGERAIPNVHVLLKDNPHLINSRNNRGYTPLQMAIRHRSSFNMPLIMELLKQEDISLAETAEDGKTVLHMACENLYHVRDKAPMAALREVIKKIVGKEPSLLKEQDFDGNTPLHLAFIKKYSWDNLDWEKISFLLKMSEIHTQNKQGLTPLLAAAHAKHASLDDVFKLVSYYAGESSLVQNNH